MSTTTIRLSPKLKARVAAASKRAGSTERRSDFHDVTEKRYAQIAASGKAIPWREMRAYLEDRVAGKKARRPVAKKLAR
jgi:hypothetical protein